MIVTKEWLEQEYITNGRSGNDIQAELQINKSALWRLMRKLGVRKVTQDIVVERTWLKQRYTVDIAPVEVIAAEANCSVDTIKSWASLWGLKRGHEFQRTEEGRSRYSIPHTDEAKAKMSVSKTKLDDGYTRGKKVGKGSRRYLHRVIAEEVLGRPLTITDLVHHMDCDKTNHHPMNLLVIERETHSALHIVMRRNPNLDQIKWLRDMGFNVEIVGDGDHQESNAFREWIAARSCGESVVRH